MLSTRCTITFNSSSAPGPVRCCPRATIVPAALPAFLIAHCSVLSALIRSAAERYLDSTNGMRTARVMYLCENIRMFQLFWTFFHFLSQRLEVSLLDYLASIFARSCRQLIFIEQRNVVRGVLRDMFVALTPCSK